MSSPTAKVSGSLTYESRILQGLSQPSDAGISNTPTDFSRADYDGLVCEELRSPFSSSCCEPESFPDTETILTQVHTFFRDVCPLYPVICDVVMHDTAVTIANNGFDFDIESCLVLVVVALASAYAKGSDEKAGLSEFSLCEKRFRALRPRFTLEYTQVQILAALFVLKKGAVLECWRRLHAGCTTLYVMLRRQVMDGHINFKVRHKLTNLKRFRYGREASTR